MARTLTIVDSNLLQLKRLVVRPIEDLLAVKNEDDFSRTKSIDEEDQDMREDITEFKTRIVPAVTIEETENNVVFNRNSTCNNGAKKRDQISGHQSGMLLEELFEVEENPHINTDENEDRKEIILDPANHVTTACNIELQMDEPCTEKHLEQPHMDESQNSQATNSVTMINNMLQIQDSEFETMEEMEEEEERLITEIERRSELQKTINEKLARIKKMREFLKQLSNIGEIEAKAEDEQMEEQLNAAIDDYLTAGEQSTSFSDNFTIVDDNGQSTCHASMVVTMKDKKLEKNQEKKTYRITYDITGSQISRSYYVFTDDNAISLQTNKAGKTKETNTSKVTTRSMKRVRKNLPTKSDLNKTVQLKKRRNTQWLLRPLNRKVIYETVKKRGRDPMTIIRNEKGRFVKKKKNL
ncbi:PREDICTED: uncharacterized protein LOC108773185 [Cyphomyrmex costatus]|uniref:Uncharacterized protein n=1 Tax=Cyphomyrmex costatus TaxID=456900 RepID=A0A195CUG2_9HYME|nr:PREDICTED: uncharacterized protein LOC108773185 [Cyphomyrmex costatus]KYN03779.1 hypothetical protein ALC62_05476 [Cyphomyrmex costatus]